MVAQTLRFDPLVRRMRDEARELGPVRMVALSQRFEPFHRDWIDDPVRGGILLNTGVHSFDLLRFLTGAEPVSLTAEVRRTHTVHTEDQFVATVVLEPGGILATVDNGRVTDGRSGRIEIVCDGGQLAGDHIHRDLVRVRGREREALGPVAPEPTVRAALRAFVDAIRTGAEPPITLRDGLAAVALADAAERSGAEGRRVYLTGSF